VLKLEIGNEREMFVCGGQMSCEQEKVRSPAATAKNDWPERRTAGDSESGAGGPQVFSTKYLWRISLSMLCYSTPRRIRCLFLPWDRSILLLKDLLRFIIT
jgi:hypothetical protein